MNHCRSVTLSCPARVRVRQSVLLSGDKTGRYLPISINDLKHTNGLNLLIRHNTSCTRNRSLNSLTQYARVTKDCRCWSNAFFAVHATYPEMSLADQDNCKMDKASGTSVFEEDQSNHLKSRCAYLKLESIISLVPCRPPGNHSINKTATTNQ